MGVGNLDAPMLHRYVPTELLTKLQAGLANPPQSAHSRLAESLVGVRTERHNNRTKRDAQPKELKVWQPDNRRLNNGPVLGQGSAGLAPIICGGRGQDGYADQD